MIEVRLKYACWFCDSKGVLEISYFTGVHFFIQSPAIFWLLRNCFDYQYSLSGAFMLKKNCMCLYFVDNAIDTRYWKSMTGNKWGLWNVILHNRRLIFTHKYCWINFGYVFVEHPITTLLLVTFRQIVIPVCKIVAECGG